MVSVESSVKAPAQPAGPKKPVSRKLPQNKDALISSSSPSISLTTPVPGGDTKKSRNDPGHQASMSKLGKVPGLSISKSPVAQTGNSKTRDDKTQTLARSSQSSMADLASQLQTELRRSKENARHQVAKTQRRPPSHQRPGVSSSKPSGGSNVVNAGPGSKSSDGNLLLASTLPPPSSIRPPAVAPSTETPAKAASTTVPTDKDSPSVQRKRLLEMIAAEKVAFL